MEYLVRGQFVLTMQQHLGADGIIRDGAVYVSGKNIIEVGPYKDLKAAYPTAAVIGSPRFWVMPGFVNAHQHGKGLTNFQLGGLDDCFEISRFSPEPLASIDPYIDTLYGCMRMIESGVTTCIHYNSSRGPSSYETDVRDRMRAYRDSGMRVSFGLDIRNRNHLVYGDEQFIKTLPSRLKETVVEKYSRSRTLAPDDYFSLVKKLSNDVRENGQERLKLFLTPAGPQWCTEDLLRAIRRASDERDLGLQMHVLETKYQRSYFSSVYGKTAIEWLNDLDFLTPRLTLAHGVWLNRNDIQLVANKGSALVHNPSSNLRLRSGMAPLPLFYKAGMTLAVGLDSSPLNDDSDMLQEARLSANLQRVPGAGSGLVPLKEIFRMATINGMKVLGWAEIAGALEPGKQADLILLDSRRLSAPYLAPHQNPIDALIYRGKADDVDTVMIGGELLYQGKKHIRLDRKSIHKKLKESIGPPSPRKSEGPEADLLPHLHRFFASWDQDPAVPFYKFNSVE
ncbi:MAG: amidohydrolase [Deltaproteobacteria bacterium]|nr:MAG: amidohydrolase [Deltaproteobacteria bacterium]